jgi:Cell division septal protein
MKTKPYAIAAALAAAAVGAAFAWRALFQVMFLENPQFAITDVVVTTGLATTKEAVKTHTGITEGVNIFSFSASKVSEDFLRVNKNVAEFTVRKTLPSKVEIIAIDREPVLRIGKSANAADKNGLVVFVEEGLRRRLAYLPILTNGDTPIDVTPGGALAEGRAKDALAIANAYQALQQGISFKIAKIDISGEIYASIETAGPGTPRRIRMPWDEINGDASIRESLAMASRVLAHPRAASYSSFDILHNTHKVYGSTSWE